MKALANILFFTSGPSGKGMTVDIWFSPNGLLSFLLSTTIPDLLTMALAISLSLLLYLTLRPGRGATDIERAFATDNSI